MNVNVQELKVDVPVSGTTGQNAVNVRPIKDASQLLRSGVNFDTYQIHEGETLHFASFKDMINPENGLLQERQVSRGSNNYFTIVKCISEHNGRRKVTYFSLPSLKRTGLEGEFLDKQEAVNPTWFDLGNDLERLKYLGAMGSITGGPGKKIKVPKEFVAGADGRLRPKTVTMKNADQSPVIKDGQEVKIIDARDTTVYPITAIPQGFQLPEEDEQA